MTRDEWSDLDVLCLTAMHKDPPHRYRSVEALARDVDNYLKSTPLDARPDSLRYVATKFLRRNKRAVSPAAIVLTLIGGVAAFYTIRLQRERSATLAEAARTQRVQSFMLNLFRGDDPSAAPAESLTVLTLVDGGAREAAALSRDPLVQAELYATLGGIYQGLGEMSQADTLLSRALAAKGRLLGDSSADVAETAHGDTGVALNETLSELANTHFYLGHYATSDSINRRVLAMSTKLYGASHPSVANDLINLGAIQLEWGHYKESEQYYHRALAINEAFEPAGDFLRGALTDLATANDSLKQPQRARRFRAELAQLPADGGGGK